MEDRSVTGTQGKAAKKAKRDRTSGKLRLYIVRWRIPCRIVGPMGLHRAFLHHRNRTRNKRQGAHRGAPWMTSSGSNHTIIIKRRNLCQMPGDGAYGLILKTLLQGNRTRKRRQSRQKAYEIQLFLAKRDSTIKQSMLSEMMRLLSVY